MLDPYQFQQAGIDHAVDFLSQATPGAKQLYGGPTGTGKSIVELHVQHSLDDCWIVTPREEIMVGMLDKLGATTFSVELALKLRITTPIRMRNMMMRNEIDCPKYIIWDEAHHQTAESYQQLELLSGICPAVGYTATPYRGSPRSTQEFREQWGEPLWLITYPEAASMGYLSVPQFQMLPLLDDDEVVVKNGEFEVESITDATVDRLDTLVSHASKHFVEYDGQSPLRWKQSTIIACPGSRMCHIVKDRFGPLKVEVVSADTPKAERQDIFRRVIARECALAHINVVTEGVDLPLECLIDLSPVMSPVKWLQQLGRITRPNLKPLYVCTNRNLLRHAYLLEGILPAKTVAEAEKVFFFSERAVGSRVVGLESIGRFKPSIIKTTQGISCTLYNLSAVEGSKVVEYAAVAHPLHEPLWFSKHNTINSDGTRSWGTWARVNQPADLRGFGSKNEQPLTDKQQAWWDRSAMSFGLDPQQKVDKKNFAILPIMKDTGLKL